MLKLALIDRVEAREWLVKHNQPWLVHQSSQQLHSLCHAFGQLPDLSLCGVAEIVAREQFAAPLAAFGQGQASQRTHKGNRFDRLHRRVKAAFFRQVSNQPADFVWLIVSENAPHALIRIDNAQQHPQSGCLARTIGS